MDWTTFINPTLTINSLALAVIALVVVSVVRGWLVPRHTHERELEQANQRAADYKELYQTADKRADILEEVAGDIVTVGETMTKVLKALPTPHQNDPEV